MAAAAREISMEAARAEVLSEPDGIFACNWKNDGTEEVFWRKRTLQEFSRKQRRIAAKI